MATKYQTTEFNRCKRVETHLQSIYSQVIAYRLTHEQLLNKLSELYQTTDYKKLTPYYQGYVSGLRKGLNDDIWRNHLAWCLGPASGPTRDTSQPWTEEMSTLCRLPGQLYGGHYWTDDDGKPTDKLFTEYKPTN
jgi:hypothetical protein